MNILKTIFINSVIYKIFLHTIVVYNNSYLKVFCLNCKNIYTSSYINKTVQKYMNSTPLYKYSFIKKINQNIYYFVVNHSKWLYNLVDKTYSKSFFVNKLKNVYMETKDNKLEMYSRLLGTFFASFAICSVFIYDNLIYALSINIAIFFVVISLFATPIKRIFYNSFTYKIAIKLLELEDSHDKD